MADPVSAISTVITIALKVKQWIDDTHEKEEILLDISATVDRLSNVLSVLERKHEKDSSLDAAVSSLGALLKKTYEHLCVWKPKKLGIHKVVAFIHPITVTEVLQKDQKAISDSILVVLLALSAVGYMRSEKAEDTQRPNVLKWIRNPEVADFWGKHVGADV